MTPLKAASCAFGGYEVLGDSNFAEQLPDLLNDAKDRLEENAGAVGTGTGQWFGTTIRATATAIDGGAITVAVVQALHGALPARFRFGGRTVWVANVAALDALRVLPMYTNGPPMLQGDNMAVWGEPAFESTSIDGTISTGAPRGPLVHGRESIQADPRN
jgi:hypothetical protein